MKHDNDLFGDPIVAAHGAGGAVAGEFLIPPFTVLNAREGWWQDRKRAWAALGIRGEVGRPDGLAFNTRDWCEEKLDGPVQSDTSIFDPVLCELVYRWFSPVGGMVLDPFAGGSVRGIVAHRLGRRYHGIELRQEQVDANHVQAAAICGTDDGEPLWVCGDAMTELEPPPVSADLVFSCPPYGDLERYSDDPRDLSTMEYHTFLANYKRIIMRALACLKPNRFACFVVGNFRNPKGGYRDFTGDTVRAFTENGCRWHNEAVLVTSVGTLALRIRAQFTNSRKMGKTHQNILVFVKGDAERAATACGEVDIT